MKNAFVTYMDKVQIDEALKDKTVSYIIQSMENDERFNSDANQRSEGRFFTKRRMSILATVACFCFVLMISNFMLQPQYYVYFDINPSIELGITPLGTISSIKGLNEDGLQFAAALELKNQKLEIGIETMLQALISQGYITKDGSTVIAMTDVFKPFVKFEGLEERVVKTLTSTLAQYQSSVVLYQETTSRQEQKKAIQQGISLGKYRIIQYMKTMDQGVNAEAYEQSSISELILKADELILSSGNDASSGEFRDLHDQILQVTEKIRNIEHNSMKNQEQTGEQSNTGSNEANNLNSSNDILNPSAAGNKNETDSQTKGNEQSQGDLQGQKNTEAKSDSLLTETEQQTVEIQNEETAQEQVQNQEQNNAQNDEQNNVQNQAENQVQGQQEENQEQNQEQSQEQSQEQDQVQNQEQGQVQNQEQNQIENQNDLTEGINQSDLSPSPDPIIPEHGSPVK